MKRFATLPNARLLQLIGLIIAIMGLVGFWLTRDIERPELSTEQQELINPEREEFQVSFVVAGRDLDAVAAASECRWVGERCVREQTGQFIYGMRTDTILYVNLVGNDLTIIAIPRDIYLANWQRRINAMYGLGGLDGRRLGGLGVKMAVEEVLGLPIDYYAIVNIDIFKNLVDVLGGVELNVPYRMYYRDAAAGLEIDFQPGVQHLSGEDAAKFVRYRHTQRGDYDRIDNVKSLAYAMLERAKELNVRAVGALPALVDTFLSDVETNATPALLGRLLLRVSNLSIRETATLPTYEVEDRGYLSYSPREVEQFLAATFGGEARVFSEPPAANLLITNRSGQPGLEEWYRGRLEAMGVPAERLLTREASFDPAPTRLLVTGDYWQDAEYFTTLLHASKQQIDHLPVVARRRVDMELVLGPDLPAAAVAAPLAQLVPQ